MIGRDDGLLLLAEDDADQRELLAELLRHEGYRVELAASPHELMQKLSLKPRLVLMDLVGITNGLIVDALRRVDRPGLVLLSGDSHLEETARRLEADAFLSKPFDVAELVALLERLMRRPQAS